MVHSHWHFSLLFLLLTTSPIFLLPHSETECDPQSKNKCALRLLGNQSREPHVEELVLINRKWKQMLQNYWIESRVYNKQVGFTRSEESTKEECFKGSWNRTSVWKILLLHCCSQYMRYISFITFLTYLGWLEKWDWGLQIIYILVDAI